MESTTKEWWGRHGPTLVVLAAAFSITFLVRTLWNIPLFQQYGTSYFFAGGSDSFYHWRVSDYILLNHRNLIVDPLLKYPFGAINPREPLFDWMNALLGMVFAPLFGGSASAAGMFALEVDAPLWAALSVFPLYLVGKEVGSRRTGLIAVLIWPFLVGNIDSSTFGYANYLSFYTFFILVMVYAELRTIRAAGSRRWVSSYRRPREIWRGLKEFLYYETGAVRWAVFAGISFGVVILTWQGYTFLIALMVGFLVLQMVIERVRGIDSFGLYVTGWIVGLVGFPLALPYYIVQGDYHIWFVEPIILYFGALLVLLPFLLLRESPWVVSLPVLIGSASFAVGLLAFTSPSAFSDIISGQGYFIKTLIYSTVAEAQAPSVDSLIISYGVVTFFLAFVGLGFVVYRLVRGQFERRHLLFLLFGGISVYLPLSAAKFFYIGSAAFSLLPAEGLSRILDIGSYPTLRRNVASLSDRRGQFAAFRRTFKVRHVLVFLLVVAIILPNVWYAIDAGIPFNSKSGYDLQVYNTLPPPLRTSATNASSFYLGAAGGQIDTPNQYDEAGYNWLAQQDTNLPEPQRPALVSWWDYGFQTISEGDHPAVADNFQNGIDPAGNFLLAQNESLGIGVLATTLLQAEQQASGQRYLPAALNAELAREGVNLTELHTLLANTSADIPLVEAYPARYLPVDPAHLDATNAMYDAVSYFLASTLPESGVAKVYDEIQAYTGWTIRYAMADTRLIPFSGQSTGIFYAPADLTDRVIDPGGNPSAYFTVSIVGSDGNTYLEGQQPPGITPVSYNINYTPAFYRTMIYHVFFGYSDQQVGQGTGIPWLTQAGASDPLEPGWMLQHFQVVYRTAYGCSIPNATAGSSCFTAMNLPQAEALQASGNGTGDTSPTAMFSNGGESILEYYPGQPVVGTVTLPDGVPIPNVRVTVDDSWGIPHMTTLTGPDGSYSLILPPGHDVLNVTSGTLDAISQQGASLLGEFNVTVPNAYGLSYNAPTLAKSLVIRPATVQGTVSWKNNNTLVGPSDVPIAGATVVLWGQGLARRTATTDASGAFRISDVPPSSYNVSVLSAGSNFTEPAIGPTAGQTYNETLSISAGSILGVVHTTTGGPVPQATITVSNAAGTTVASVRTNATGFFAIGNVGTGNFTVVATTTNPVRSSQPQLAKILRPGGNATFNLTIAPVHPVEVQVLEGGAPIAGVPVRFTEILAPSQSLPSNNTTGPPRTQAESNTSVQVTNAAGQADILLPDGNYSVYALGVNGSSVYAGFWSGPIGPGATVPAISLAPAVELSGQANGTTNVNISAPLQVAAFDGAGHTVWAYANRTGGYALWLPRGTYTISATSLAPPISAQAVVDLTGPTTLDLKALGAILTTTKVLAASDNQPIPGAQVRYTYLPTGSTVVAATDAQGDASAILPVGGPAPGAPPPTTLPTYCVNVTAPGYTPSDQCGIPSGNISQQLPTVPLAGAPTPVTVVLDGVPTGVPVEVNLTAASTGARTVQVTGLSPIHLTALPGRYTVSAWAPSTGAGRYLPTTDGTTLSLAPAEPDATLTLPMAFQVPVHGALTIPSGTTLATAHVTLLSPAMNRTLTGTQYTTTFFTAPGTYRILATVAGVPAGRFWSGSGTVQISSAGTVSASLALTTPAAPFFGTVEVPGGSPLPVPAVLTFVAPNGGTFPVPVAGGTYNATLPINVSYRPYLNVTTSFVEANRTVVEALQVPIGQACLVLQLGTACNIVLQGRAVQQTVGGQLEVPGSPAPVPGSVLFQGTGPAPLGGSHQLATAANGSFSLALPPGNYSVYANASSGTYALLTTVDVALGATAPVDLTLRPAWTATVSVQPPSGGWAIGSVHLTVQAFDGSTLTLANVPLQSPIRLPLPTGTYSLTARAASAPYGVPTNATASATLSLLAGNAAVNLALSEVLTPSVAVSVVTASTTNPIVLLPADGGLVRFGFVVRNTGDLPVQFTLSVTPSIWNSTITPSNVTLGTGARNSTVTGEFSVRVPSGTAVAHAPIFLVATLAGTSDQVGKSTTPAPVSIAPRFGVRLGESASVAPDVTPGQATIGLYTLNTGNLPETVGVSVVDGARLAQLGWTAAISSNGASVTGPLSIGFGGNSSVRVVLNATRAGAIPPGTVTVAATIVNATYGMVQSVLTVDIPTASVSSNASAISVVGPNVGSPSSTPDWLVPVLSFVPAAALAGVLLGYRWYRTRRWVH